MPPPTLRWVANTACDLHWRDWGADHVLFNNASGQTHFLNELGAASLMLLSRRPLTEDELCRLLCDELGLDRDAELYNYLVDMLRNMDDLGLVEPVLS